MLVNYSVSIYMIWKSSGLLRTLVLLKILHACLSVFQKRAKLSNVYRLISLPPQEGKSLLIVAAKGGHELVLLTLLDGGADVHFIHQVYSG